MDRRRLFDLEDIRQEKAERCRQSLRYFFKQAWHVMEPGVPLTWNWHLDAIFEHLEAVMRGDIRRLVVNIAPGHAKSTIFSVALPAWAWTQDPTQRWLCASYSLDLALRDNNNCRALIESDWYQSLFGDSVQMKADQNTKGFFENTQRGYRLCTSVASKGTGKRGTHLLIDDPNDSKATQGDLDEAIKWHGRTWMSRLNDLQFGSMICVGQRIHQRDLTAHLLSLGGWEHFALPTEYEPSRKHVTSIGWSDPRTEEGELLWPQKFPREVLDELKVGLGSMAYAAQYQQSPVPATGGTFQKQWLRYYANHDTYYELEKANGIKRVMCETCRRIITVDLAISEKQSADYTVFAVWDVTPEHEALLVDLYRERIDNPTQQKQIKLVYQRWRPQYILIESVAYQLALVQQARNDGIPVREYIPPRNRDKAVRATTAAVMMEGEKIFLPKQASWLMDYETELLMFPKGAHDDMVDPTSMIAEEIGMPHTGGVVTVEDTDEPTNEQESAWW